MTVKAVFLGSPDFAVPCLEAMAHSTQIDVRLILTQPDRPAGRGRRLTPPAVKVAADELGLASIQPESVDGVAVRDALKAETPDLLVVVAYGEWLTREVLEIASCGAINVHPSLLPKYRGSTPIQAAILNGDEITGVSFIQLTERLDAGPVIAQYPVAVQPRATTGTLSEELALLASNHICEVCIGQVEGTIGSRSQCEDQASYTREWSRENAKLDWSSPVSDLERLVRASQPWPVAWTLLDGQPFRIHRTSISNESSSTGPGTVARIGDSIIVTTGSDPLILEEVQPPGKRRISAAAWWNGLQAKSVTFENV